MLSIAIKDGQRSLVPDWTGTIRLFFSKLAARQRLLSGTCSMSGVKSMMTRMTLYQRFVTRRKFIYKWTGIRKRLSWPVWRTREARKQRMELELDAKVRAHPCRIYVISKKILRYMMKSEGFHVPTTTQRQQGVSWILAVKYDSGPQSLINAI